MPLLHAIEFSNFMNYRRTSPWSPDWRHERFLLAGLHAAINIPNGRGKSTLFLIILSMLVWDRKTLRDLQKKHWAPPSSPSHTHVRIEITNRNAAQPDLLLGVVGPTGGDHIVFGIYGNAGEGETPEFYAYRGTLDDCPLARMQDDKKALITREEFLGNLKRQDGLFPSSPRDRQESEWRRYVGDFFDMSSLQQQYKYQLANGAEGSAKYFDVDTLRGNYSAELFYKHLAPELLSEVMGGYGEDDERGIEDTIHEKASGVVRAQRETRQKTRELDEAQRVLKSFQRLDTLGVTIRAKSVEVEQIRGALAVEMRALENVLIEQPVPGVPQPPCGQQPTFYGHFVLQDGELWLTDRGIGVMTGEDARIINQRADRQRIRPRDIKISEVIDFACDHGSAYAVRKQGGGKGSKLYNRDATLAVIETSSNLSSPWTRETALAAIAIGFQWATTQADTNPGRRQLVEIDLDLARHRIAQEEAEDAQSKAQTETREIQAELKALERSSVAWRQMVDSRFFSAEELADCEGTAQQVKVEADAARQALNTHLATVAARTPDHEQWLDFVRRHGEGVTPGAIADDLARASKVAQATAAERRQTVQDLRNKVKNADDVKQAVEQSFEAMNRRLSVAENLLTAARRFTEIFGDDAPDGLEQRVLREKDNASNSHNTCRIALSRMDKGLEAVKAFSTAFPGEDPAVWLSIRKERRQTCNQIVQDRQRELQTATMRRNRVAANVVAAREFPSLFGSEPPVGLEARVREELTAVQAQRSERQTQLARIEGLVAAVAQFEAAHGPINPSAWLADRQVQRDEARRALDTATRDLSEVRTKRKTLDTSPVAAGRVAREVAELAGPAATALHEFVAQQSLDDARKTAILTLFSALLFSPVFNDEAEAAKAAAVLAEQGIEAPIFLGPQLEAFCRSAKVQIDGTVVSALLVGVRTRQVECLLDPTLIEREKAARDAEIGALQKRHDELQVVLDGLDPTSEAESIARKAAEAHAKGVPERAAVLRREIALIAESIPEFERRASDGATASIRALLVIHTEIGLPDKAPCCDLDATLDSVRSTVDALSAQIASVRSELDTLAQFDDAEPVATVAAQALCECVPEQAARLQTEIGNLELALPDLERRASQDAIEAIRATIRLREVLGGESVEALTAARDELLCRRDEARRIDKELRDSLQTQERSKEDAELASNKAVTDAVDVPRLRSIQEYVDCPAHGPAFMARQAGEAQRLRVAADQAGKREHFDFVSATTFMLAGGTNKLDALSGRLGQISDESKARAGEIRRLGEAIAAAYPKRDPLFQAATQIDAAVVRLRKRWAAIGEVLGDLPLDVSAEISNKHPLREAAEGWRGASSAVEIAAHMSVVADNLITSEDAETIEALRKAQTALRRAYDDLDNEIDRTLDDATLRLPESARIKLAQAKDSPDFLSEMLTMSEASFHKNQEANRIADEHLRAERDQLGNWLKNFTLRLPDNMKTLKRVFAPSVDADGRKRAGFEIDANVIDQTGVANLIEQIIRTVENLENNELTSAGVPEKLREKMHHTLRQEIRETFYRQVIVSPRIRLALPSMSARALEMERKMASSGQGVAITFLWILKLAEFVNEREIRRQTVDRAKRRNLRDKASAFTILDGAFSHLSDKRLINETLEGIENSLGRFQLIITGHDPAYENDFKRFPALIAAREMTGQYMRAWSYHHEKGAVDALGQESLMETFHAIQIPRASRSTKAQPA